MLEKGFSLEKKYVLSKSGRKKYLLRITSISNAGYPDVKNAIEEKNAEFLVIKRLSRLSSLIPKAHFFGLSEDERTCYMVLDYISGKDAEDVLPSLSSDEQYDLGFFAGEELLKLHMLDAPSGILQWYDRYSQKYARKCAVFNEINISAKEFSLDRISRFISANSNFMKCDRQSFLHDDYHPANLIVKDGKLSGIIDFNRYDWGDPVHDFVKTAYFSSAISTPFSKGQIDGYNKGSPSCIFWKKYSLYAAMTVIPDIVWSCWYSDKTGSRAEVERMRERVKMVCQSHKWFESEIPIWYD